MNTVTADVWIKPEVAEYAEWLRGKFGRDAYVFTVGVIEGIQISGCTTPQEKCQRTVAALAALAAVEAEYYEVRL